jgi:uncharacterized protein YdhG (YjbR/CyaY superfamily)
MAEKPADIDAYLAGFPDDVRAILERVRRALHAALPEAPESIRYGMPALMLGKRAAIYFGGWKHHVGVYPVARGDDEEFEAAVAPYRAATDSLHFRYDEAIPYELITRVARTVAQRYSA